MIKTEENKIVMYFVKELLSGGRSWTQNGDWDKCFVLSNGTKLFIMKHVVTAHTQWWLGCLSIFIFQASFYNLRISP